MKKFVILLLTAAVSGMRMNEPGELAQMSAESVSGHREQFSFDMPKINLEGIKKDAENVAKKVEEVKAKVEETAKPVADRVDEKDKQALK